MMSLVATATAVIALAGASTALATRLYSGPVALPTGTNIEMSLTGSTSIKTTGGLALETCSGSSVKGQTQNAGGSTETVRIAISRTSMTWLGCSHLTQTIEGGELEIHHIAGTVNGTVTAKGFKFTTTGNFGGSCVYTFGAGTVFGTLTGKTSGSAVIDINTVIQRESGASSECMEEKVWTGTYAITSPAAVTVTAS